MFGSENLKKNLKKIKQKKNVEGKKKKDLNLINYFYTNFLKLILIIYLYYKKLNNLNIFKF